MIADRLFEEGTVPEWTTAEWYEGREVAPHLEQQGHRERLALAASMIEPYLHPAVSLVDLGAGDGGFLSVVAPRVGKAGGYDLAPANVQAAADRGVCVETLDVVSRLNEVQPADIVVVMELLEHLVDPHGLLRALHSTGAQFLLASSPYTETAASHYEFHTYAWDREGYEAMLEDAGWKVVRSDVAWICQVVLCVR